MQYLPEGISDRDIDQWLSGGYYVGFEGSVLRYRYAEDGMVVGENQEGDEIRTPSQDVMVHWPLCGAVNVTGMAYAVYLKRRQARQWRRTFNMREIDVFVPDKWEIMKRFRAKGQVDLERVPMPRTANAAFHPVYPSMGSAAVMLDSTVAYTVALSPHVIVGGIGKRRVYLREELVAMLDGKRVVPVTDVRKARRIVKVLGGEYGL